MGQYNDDNIETGDNNRDGSLGDLLSSWGNSDDSDDQNRRANPRGSGIGGDICGLRTLPGVNRIGSGIGATIADGANATNAATASNVANTIASTQATTTKLHLAESDCRPLEFGEMGAMQRQVGEEEEHGEGNGNSDCNEELGTCVSQTNGRVNVEVLSRPFARCESQQEANGATEEQLAKVVVTATTSTTTVKRKGETGAGTNVTTTTAIAASSMEESASATTLAGGTMRELESETATPSAPLAREIQIGPLGAHAPGGVGQHKEWGATRLTAPSLPTSLPNVSAEAQSCGELTSNDLASMSSGAGQLNAASATETTTATTTVAGVDCAVARDETTPSSSPQAPVGAFGPELDIGIENSTAAGALVALGEEQQLVSERMEVAVHCSELEECESSGDYSIRTAVYVAEPIGSQSLIDSSPMQGDVGPEKGREDSPRSEHAPSVREEATWCWWGSVGLDSELGVPDSKQRVAGGELRGPRELAKFKDVSGQEGLPQGGAGGSGSQKQGEDSIGPMEQEVQNLNLPRQAEPAGRK